MDILREKLERIDLELDDVLKRVNEELRQMPEGKLCCYSSGHNKYYSKVIQDKGQRIRKGINRNPVLISELARKDYLTQLRIAAEHNQRLMQYLLSHYHSMDPANLIEEMSRAARNIRDLSFLTEGRVIGGVDDDAARSARMEVHRKWANETYEQSTYKPEEKIHLSSSGIYVRSKSELSIIEKLFNYDVPNRYEQIIYLDGRRYAPDFTFQDKDYKLFFLEHAGMMNDPDYARRHLNKMRTYEQHGIVPWKNLIVTYDAVDGGINMAQIDSIIKYQILPRL